MPTNTNLEEVIKSVAEAAWERQAQHNRFRFKEARPAGHPSRVHWVTANNAWQASVRERKERQPIAT